MKYEKLAMCLPLQEIKPSTMVPRLLFAHTQHLHAVLTGIKDSVFILIMEEQKMYSK